MATFGFIEYQDATPEVRAVYDDIMATRRIDWINNFWKAIAHDPALLKRTWESIKQIMGPGALDPLTKELIYIAVSVTNNCNYCIASHTASAFGKGMTDAMFKELQAIIGMANETNKLVTGYLHCSTHVLWLALFPEAEHIDVYGEPCFRQGGSEISVSRACQPCLLPSKRTKA